MQGTLFVISALLSLAAGVFYITDVVRGSVRPHRFTWFAVMSMNTVIFLTIHATPQGQGMRLWFQGSYVLGSAAVFVTSLWRGAPGKSALDKVCLGGALVAGFIYVLFHTAALALIVVLVTNFLAFVPTLVKAYRDPASESKSNWYLAWVGAVCYFVAIVVDAVSARQPSLVLVYACYMLLMNSALAYLSSSGRRLG